MVEAIGDYDVVELLNRGAESLVYRARRRVDGARVVLKCVRRIDPTPDQVSWFVQEFEMLQSLRIEGAPKVSELEWLDRAPFFAMEDVGGRSLDRVMRSRRFSAREALELAARLAAILGRIHARGVVHKNVAPANIVLDEATGRLELIDYGAAAPLRQEASSFGSLTAIEGTLEYVSPEQTGRINRPIDYRSDHYSLGATLYELLCGAPPFAGADALAILNAHIAERPRPPAEVDPALPRVASDIVLALLEKEPERRYRTAAGLIHDLERAARVAAGAEAEDRFALRAADASGRLEFSGRRVGREAELARLSAAFEAARADGDAPRLVVVGGRSGIGKTTLARELERPVTLARGYFVAGKFDPYTRDAPCTAIVAALRDLLKMIVADESARLDAWRERLEGALGHSAGLAVDLAPELAAFLGPAGGAAEAGAAEGAGAAAGAGAGAGGDVVTEVVVADLLRALAREDRPLVLFLDDLQWADAASIGVIRTLAAAEGLRGLLIVAACRSDEVDATHRFTLMREDLAAAGRPALAIELPPLGAEGVAAMLEDALGAGPTETADLAAAVRRITGGNPFLVQRLMARLHRERALRYDPAAGRWRWDLDDIARLDVAEGALGLMTAEIRGASPETREALRLAACLGATFDLGRLSRVAGRPASEMAEALWPALEQGWLAPAGRRHRLMRLRRLALPPNVAISLRFGHDRIREAVYETMDPAERRDRHWRIGLSLAEPGVEPADPNRVLEIAGHLNLGTDPARAEAHAERLMEVNLDAGLRAKASGAHAVAFAHLEMGIALSRPGDWDRRPDLMRPLLEAAAETAFLAGAGERTDAWTEQLLRHAEDAAQRAAAHEIRIHAARTGRGHPAAVALGAEALAELGIDLPVEAGPAEMDAAVEAVHAALAGREIAALADLPPMTDPRDLAAMRLYHGLLASAFSSFPDLFVVLTSRMVALSIERGLSSMSITAFADFAIVLCGRRDAIEPGYEFGRLAVDLVQRLGAHDVEARVIFMYNAFVQHWKHPLGESLAPLREAHQIGLERGDAQYAALAAFDHGFNLFWLGGSLQRIASELDRFDEAIARTGQGWVRTLNQMYRQATAALASPSRMDASLNGEHFDAEAQLARFEAARSANGIAQIRILRLMLNFLFGAYEAAEAEADAAARHLSGVASTAAIPAFHMYAALARLAPMQAGRGGAALGRVAESRALLALWAERSPANYRHKHLLVEAEVARVEGREAEARDLFERAVDLARDAGYRLDEALACERAGRFFLGAGRRRLAGHFLRDAHEAWSQCGAAAKVRSLEAEIHLLLERPGAAVPAGTAAARAVNPTAAQLDFRSVLEASQAISKEIVLPRLLRRLMGVLIEASGATHGRLLLRAGAGWSVEAAAWARPRRVAVRAEEGGDGDEDAAGALDPATAPLPLIEMAAGSRRDVIVHDARDEVVFAARRRTGGEGPISALCHPIEMQGEVAAVLYLENDLLAGAFSRQRLEVLKPLCAQAAISIENARLLERQMALAAAANRFVPDELARVLGRGALPDVRLGDHAQRDMALLVTDIRDFTGLSERMSPQEVFDFVNAYLAATDPAFHDHGGIVVKYMGDSQMAVFPGGAAESLTAAVAICRGVEAFNAGRRASGLEPIAIGIGLHVGHVMLGIVGGGERCQLDILSDNVNLVSRVEKLTRDYGVRVIATDAVLDRLPAGHGFATRFLGRAAVRGRHRETGVHELLDAEDAATRAARIATRAAFEAAVAADLRGETAGAREGFEAVLRDDPGDAAARLCLARLTGGGGGATPPSAASEPNSAASGARLR